MLCCQFHIIDDLITPNVPAISFLTGKSLNARHIPHKSLDSFPYLIWLFTVFFHMRNNDLMDVLRLSLRMAPNSK